ncbi:MAG: response regulator, partial [Treponema sp.]|nr:response regulator [Treponema sp.]
MPVFTSYLDVPGVTAEEISAIEELKKQYTHFTYGMLPTTEAFRKEDGEIGGFSALFCEWLSELFGIRFELEFISSQDPFGILQRGEVDFSGEIRITEERQQIYISAGPIALRSMKMIRKRGGEPINNIAMTRLPRYAFIRDTASIGDVAAVTEPGSFEIVLINLFGGAYGMLERDEIDALIVLSPAEAHSDIFGDIVIEDFFPLIFSPVSMVTVKQEFAPIISVVQKVLDNGGFQFFNELYRKGYEEYRKFKLFLHLTEEEKEYLRNTSVVPLTAGHELFPISFFNKFERKWEGSAFDILNEVEKLTGLSFEVVNDEQLVIEDTARMLLDGSAHITPVLIFSDTRRDYFLWPKNTYLKDRYALLSKRDFPNIGITEIPSSNIGLIKDSGYSAMFKTLFPETQNTREYATHMDALNALERGEIDLIMATLGSLLIITNYYELLGYKANFIFEPAFDMTFGFNREQAVLCSIVDKALLLIETDRIVSYWETTTYDYQARLLRAQRPWLFGAIGLTFIILTLMFVLFVRSRYAGKKLEKLVLLRTRELQLRTEEALAASHTKSAFLAIMSHEIRTPMNSIMGFAELSADSESIVQIKDYMEKITDSTKWLLHIINDILDISKIEAGKMELEHVAFDLSDVFSRCQSVILPAVKEKCLHLDVYTDQLTDKKVVGDPVRLYQVLINLLSNAVKFTNSGTISFSSVIKDLSDSKISVFFEVKDSGIGMTSEQAYKVFDQFTQADSSTTRDFGGTGLGLTISKNIVELMGGTLKVQSASGVGSTFSFEIVFDTIDVSDDTTKYVNYNFLEKPYFKGIVLLCDDNIMNQEVVNEHLSRVGLSTVIAENGKTGVKMVQRRINAGEKPFDLILMDIYMPVMDGIEAANKINALNTGTPIIAMTANMMTSELEKYKKNGMPDCLGKPFTSQELWYILLKYLKPSGLKPSNDLNNDELQTKLRLNFVKNNQTKCEEIFNAINAGDIKLAHRLAHTLKGNAGMIGKIELQKAAEEIESLLNNGTIVQESKINRLKTELEAVIEELKPLLNEPAQQKNYELPKKDELIALSEKLADMLKSINPECLSLVDELRIVPGTGELI